MNRIVLGQRIPLRMGQDPEAVRRAEALEAQKPPAPGTQTPPGSPLAGALFTVEEDAPEITAAGTFRKDVLPKGERGIVTPPKEAEALSSWMKGSGPYYASASDGVQQAANEYADHLEKTSKYADSEVSKISDDLRKSNSSTIKQDVASVKAKIENAKASLDALVKQRNLDYDKMLKRFAKRKIDDYAKGEIQAEGEKISTAFKDGLAQIRNQFDAGIQPNIKGLKKFRSAIATQGGASRKPVPVKQSIPVKNVFAPKPPPQVPPPGPTSMLPENWEASPPVYAPQEEQQASGSGQQCGQFETWVEGRGCMNMFGMIAMGPSGGTPTATPGGGGYAPSASAGPSAPQGPVDVSNLPGEITGRLGPANGSTFLRGIRVANLGMSGVLQRRMIL